MAIDWTSFTPWAALAGGLLIGVATAMFVLLNGRIADVTASTAFVRAASEANSANG